MWSCKFCGVKLLMIHSVRILFSWAWTLIGNTSTKNYADQILCIPCFCSCVCLCDERSLRFIAEEAFSRGRRGWWHGWVLISRIYPKVFERFSQSFITLVFYKFLYLLPTAGVIEEEGTTSWLTANLAAILVPSVTVLCLGGLALLFVRKLCCNCKTCLRFVRLVSRELGAASLRLSGRHVIPP